MIETDKIIALKKVYKQLKEIETVLCSEDILVEEALDKLHKAIVGNYEYQFRMNLNKSMEDIRE